MEVNREKAIVMNQRGQFDEIDATPSMKVGNEIEYGENNTMKVVSALCMVLITITSLFGFQIYGNHHTPVSFVSLEINPTEQEYTSVEFTLNAYDQIISAVPNSEAATLVLAGNKYKGLNIEEAFSVFLQEANELGYVDGFGRDVAVLISVAMDDDNAGIFLENKLMDHVNQFFMDEKILGVVLNDESNYVLKNEAENEGMSVSKYRLVNQVANQGNVTKEEAAAMSIKDLNKIVENKAVVTDKTEEMLIQEKEQVKEQVAKAREAEPSVASNENFGGVLAEYQNNMSEVELEKIFEAVNESLKPKEEESQDPIEDPEEIIEPLVCTNLEDGTMGACPDDQEICFDEEKQIYYVCPLDKDLCMSDTSEYRFICPADKQICTDESGNKFICPVQTDPEEQYEPNPEQTIEQESEQMNQETQQQEQVDDYQPSQTETEINAEGTVIDEFQLSEEQESEQGNTEGNLNAENTEGSQNTSEQTLKEQVETENK